MESFATPHLQGCIINLHITPGAKHNAIIGLSHTPQGNPALKITLHAKPTDGEANTALLAFLAQKLALAKSTLTLLSGHTSRHKRVFIPLPPTTTLTILHP